MTFDIFINIQTGQVVVGPKSTTNSTLPKLYCPDTPTFRIFLLQPVPGAVNGVAPFTGLPTAGLQLFVYLNDGTLNGTVYTQQITWTPGVDATYGPYFTATVALNTNALETQVTNTGTKGFPCQWMVGFVQAGLQSTVQSLPVTVYPGIPSNAIAPAPAGQVSLSVQAADQRYVPLNGNPGQAFYVVSPAGKKIAVFAQDNPDGTASLADPNVN